ncbi:aspartate dehydrogenase domain-containing protein [Emergencia timonensis]|uniref:aspartate dehydrogenase domain-containing protein n=1 Tax=Emergencia timonensis TaxID=1776384 RepID=UPI003991FBD3
MIKKKFAIIGDGFLAANVADAYAHGKMPNYELTCILGRIDERLDELSTKCNCKAVKTLDALLATEPEIVAEMAAVEAVQEYCIDVLKSGVSFMALSIGAFADSHFYETAKEAASENNVKIYFSSGTIGAFDAMQSITLIGGAKAELTLNRWAGSYKDTPVYKPEIEATGVKDTLFEGTAAEAIQLLPRMINIGVATSLATVGPENTYIKITGDPDMPHNDDDVNIRVHSEHIDMKFKIYSKNQILTGWSVVSFLNNLASPVYFY